MVLLFCFSFKSTVQITNISFDNGDADVLNLHYRGQDEISFEMHDIINVDCGDFGFVGWVFWFWC